jgi:hypothetical protein
MHLPGQFLFSRPRFSAFRSCINAKRRSTGIVLAACLTLLITGAALAQTSLTTLYTFTGKNGDGANPVGDLTMDSQGLLYGVDPTFGRAARIYQLTPAMFGTGFWSKTNLYTGSPGTPVGGHLRPVILGKNGELYGTSDVCPGVLHGCVFQLEPPASAGGAWTMNVLYGFQGETRGDGKQVAYGKLAMDGSGNLYGVTQSGGVSASKSGGTVYQLSPPATPGGLWTEQVLYRFQNVRGGFFYPQVNATLGNDGALYGSTRLAQNQKGFSAPGVIYRLAPPAVPGGAWTATVIYDAIAGHGFFAGVSQLTMAPTGTLYGVSTYVGGAFALTPPAVPGQAWTLSRLPSDTLGGPGLELALDADGNLYGTDGGSVYKLTHPAAPGGAWTRSALHTFLGGNEGSRPHGRPLIDSSGNVFGTTLSGGVGTCRAGTGELGCGTVFELQ